MTSTRSPRAAQGPDLTEQGGYLAAGWFRPDDRINEPGGAVDLVMFTLRSLLYVLHSFSYVYLTGQAQFERPGQPDDVNQRFGAGQVRTRPSAGSFMHSWASSASTRRSQDSASWNPAADGVTADRGHRHDAGSATTGIRPGRRRSTRRIQGIDRAVQGVLAGYAVGREQAQVYPGGK